MSTDPGWWTEAAWREAENPHHLCELLIRQRIKGQRKYRLAAVACCRRYWEELPDSHRQAVLACERYADKRATDGEVNTAHRASNDAEAYGTIPVRAAKCINLRPAKRALSEVLFRLLSVKWPGPALDPFGGEGPREAWADACWTFCRYLRDIFGNPFRPPTPLPREVLRWNAGTVAGIAEGIYEEKAFDQVPILADALEDAGCADAGLLDHCRGSGEHVRGCWAVDLVLRRT